MMIITINLKDREQVLGDVVLSFVYDPISKLYSTSLKPTTDASSNNKRISLSSTTHVGVEHHPDETEST